MQVTEYKFYEKLTKLPFVRAIFLYGSRARGDEEERSDIDLAIVCPEATENQWRKILEIIADADTLLKVDCVRFDQLAEDDTLRKNILKVKKVLFERIGG